MVTKRYQQLVKESTLAGLLDVSTRTLRTWRSEGRIPYHRLSAGVIRYDVNQVFTALDQRAVGVRQKRRAK